MNTQSYIDKIENYRYNKHMNKRSSIKRSVKGILK